MSPRASFSGIGSLVISLVASVVPAIAIVLVLTSGCQRAPHTDAGSPSINTSSPDKPPAGSDSASVRAGIDTGNTNLIDALIAGNSDLLAACYAQDAAIVLPNGGFVAGRDSIRALARRTLTHIHVTTGKMRTVSVRVIDDQAYETGQWAFNAGPIGGSPQTMTGSYVNIWKNERGAWKLWRAIAAPPANPA
jgi:ketosteroid isomerase-like protein